MRPAAGNAESRSAGRLRQNRCASFAGMGADDYIETINYAQQQKEHSNLRAGGAAGGKAVPHIYQQTEEMK